MQAIDQTEYFVDILKSELENFIPQKGEFIKVKIESLLKLHYTWHKNKYFVTDYFVQNCYREILFCIFQDFTLTDYNELVEGWEIKIVRCNEGEQGWGLFIATKEA